VRQINLHGIYSHQDHADLSHAQILRPDGDLPGFHLHVLNEPEDAKRKMDSRELFLKPQGRVNDTDVGEFVRRAVVARRRRKAARRAAERAAAAAKAKGG